MTIGNKFIPILFTIAVVQFLLLYNAYAANIDPLSDGHKYSYTENTGWLNFNPGAGPGVDVNKTSLGGYIWEENVGWIKLDPENGGVTQDGKGNLAGYGWGENIGWINFSCENNSTCNTVSYGVKVDRKTGVFSGYAWGENIGWISFNYGGFPSSSDYYVTTSWRNRSDFWLMMRPALHEKGQLVN